MNKIKWNTHKSSFFKILKTQREKSKYTDATLAVDGKFYPVHKLVLSTCSEYFEEIFERTDCKSPVIVLKDVNRHDIEALLDYIYIGQVNINQDNLASLLKTAECLRIKGLGVPDERQIELQENFSSSQDDGSPYNHPAKRRRHDPGAIHSHAASPVTLSQNSDASGINSNTMPNISSIPSNTEQSTAASIDSVHASSLPPCSANNASNPSQEHPTEVKIEVDDTEQEEMGITSKNIFNPDFITDSDHKDVCEFNVKKEQDPENNANDPFPEVSIQEFDQNTDESLVVKVGLDNVIEQDRGIRQENDYSGSASICYDSFPNSGSDVSVLQQNQEFVGAFSAAGPSKQPNCNFGSFNKKNQSHGCMTTIIPTDPNISEDEEFDDDQDPDFVPPHDPDILSESSETLVKRKHTNPTSEEKNALDGEDIPYKALQVTKPMSHKGYRLEVFKGIRGSNPFFEHHQRSLASYSGIPFHAVRFDSTLNHVPIYMDRQTCKQCSHKNNIIRTNFVCKICKVHLCLNSERNCFVEYHDPEA